MSENQQTLFQRFTCGCVGIDLGRHGTINNHNQCLVVSYCDTDDGNLGFSFRNIEQKKIVQNYLPEAEFQELVGRIHRLMINGNRLLDFVYSLEEAKKYPV